MNTSPSPSSHDLLSPLPSWTVFKVSLHPHRSSVDDEDGVQATRCNEASFSFISNLIPNFPPFFLSFILFANSLTALFELFIICLMSCSPLAVLPSSFLPFAHSFVLLVINLSPSALICFTLMSIWISGCRRWIAVHKPYSLWQIEANEGEIRRTGRDSETGGM